MPSNNQIKIIYMGGYRGIMNLGDHAMALNMIERLRARVRNIQITILVNDFKNPLNNGHFCYSYTFFRGMGKFRKILNAFYIGKLIDEFLQLLKCFYIVINGWLYNHVRIFLPMSKETSSTIVELSQSDLIWFGGGGHINDIATISGVYGTTVLCILAIIFNKEVIMTGQGLGPLEKKINKKLLSLVLPRVKFIALRDYSESKNILKKLGVPESKIILVGDDAASLRTTTEDRISKIFDKEDIKLQSLTFGVQFRKTNYTKPYEEKEIRIIAKILDYLVETFDARILFIPTNYEKSVDDRDAEFNIFKNMNNKKDANFIVNEYDPFEIKSIIGKMNFFLGFSYHPLVFALTQAVPSICFYNNEYYFMKNKGLFDWFSLGEFAINLNSFSFESFEGIVNKLFSESENIRGRLNKGTNEMVLRLENLLDRIQGILTREKIKKIDYSDRK